MVIVYAHDDAKCQITQRSFISSQSLLLTVHQASIINDEGNQVETISR